AFKRGPEAIPFRGDIPDDSKSQKRTSTAEQVAFSRREIGIAFKHPFRQNHSERIQGHRSYSQEKSGQIPGVGALFLIHAEKNKTADEASHSYNFRRREGAPEKF